MNFLIYGVLKRLGEDTTKSIGEIYVRFWDIYDIEKNLKKSLIIRDFILKKII